MKTYEKETMGITIYWSGIIDLSDTIFVYRECRNGKKYGK